METVLVILGLLGAARSLPQHPQPVQHFYNPQTGQHYIYYQGYMYEQNVSQGQGYQGQAPQGMATPNWAPQPPAGQWYPQQFPQTAANPQVYPGPRY